MSFKDDIQRIFRQVNRVATPTREPGTVKGLKNGVLTVTVAGRDITTLYTGADDLQQNDGVWMMRDPDSTFGNNYSYDGPRGYVTRSPISSRMPVHADAIRHVTTNLLDRLPVKPYIGEDAVDATTAIAMLNALRAALISWGVVAETLTASDTITASEYAYTFIGTDSATISEAAFAGPSETDSVVASESTTTISSGIIGSDAASITESGVVT